MQYGAQEVSGPVFLLGCLIAALLCWVGMMLVKWIRKSVTRCARCGVLCEPRTATGGYGVIDPFAAMVHTICESCHEALSKQ